MNDLPYPIDKHGTHHADCWRDRGHHNCAVGKVRELQQRIATLAARAEQAESERDHFNRLRMEKANEVNQLREALNSMNNLLRFQSSDYALQASLIAERALLTGAVE